jgi:hypothetical protein
MSKKNSTTEPGGEASTKSARKAQKEKVAEASKTNGHSVKDAALGWNADLSKFVREALVAGELVKDIDREILHLVMALTALSVGDFEIAYHNLLSCGLAEAPAEKEA